MIYSVRLIIRYLVSKEFISDEEATSLKKKLSNIKSNADNYVPNLNEISLTLNKLNPAYRSVYLMYLMSGIRKNEGDYVLTNLKALHVQDNGSFVKISLDLYRGNKNAYFCYLSKDIYLQLVDRGISNVSGLDAYIKRKELIPIKYARKWFYSKCIELGIPEGVADYYQGRISTSIGSKNYLSKQVLADKFYGEMVLKISTLFT
jgi:intergrase/recombinase